MKKLIATCTLLALLNTAVHAQSYDYNPDGTPTLRTQCLQNPGLCDGPGSSDGTYAGTSDPIGDAIGVLLLIGIGCALSGLCTTGSDANKKN